MDHGRRQFTLPTADQGMRRGEHPSCDGTTGHQESSRADVGALPEERSRWSRRGDLAQGRFRNVMLHVRSRLCLEEVR